MELTGPPDSPHCKYKPGTNPKISRGETKRALDAGITSTVESRAKMPAIH